MHIDLSNINEVMNAKALELLKRKERFIVSYGGASSGKSVGTAQVLMIKALNETPHRILIARKYATSSRHSTFQLIKDIISNWGLTKLFTVNKSEMRITCVNGNEFLFVGLDDVEKLKSIVGLTTIWIEESTEVSLSDFEQLNIRLRGKTQHSKQIFLTFNPTSSKSWLKKRFFDRELEDTFIQHSTYRDNKFCDEETAKNLEMYATTDEFHHRVYNLGEWGLLSGAIYDKYTIVDELPKEYEVRRYGLDFGFENPTALCEVRFIDTKLYIKEVIYQSKLTTNDLIKLMEHEGISKSDLIVADSAEPDRIEQIKRKGYNIRPAIKHVLSGIDRVNQYQLHATNDSQNLIFELENYQWATDKQGEPLDRPVKQYDHILDAVRYSVMIEHHQSVAISTAKKHYSSKGFRGYESDTFSPPLTNEKRYSRKRGGFAYGY